MLPLPCNQVTATKARVRDPCSNKWLEAHQPARLWSPSVPKDCKHELRDKHNHRMRHQVLDEHVVTMSATAAHVVAAASYAHIQHNHSFLLPMDFPWKDRKLLTGTWQGLTARRGGGVMNPMARVAPAQVRGSSEAVRKHGAWKALCSRSSSNTTSAALGPYVMAPGCNGRGLQATRAGKDCRCKAVPTSLQHMLLAFAMAMEVTLWHDDKGDAGLCALLYKASAAPDAAAGEWQGSP